MRMVLALAKTGRRLGVTAVAALVCCPVSVQAQDCKQDVAVYHDREKAYELRFAPVPSQAAVTSHMFKISLLKTTVVLNGVVLPTEGVERSGALVMNNCPEGDATGQELEACTIWEGVAYGVDAAGAIDNLPKGADPASARIVLADFGRSVRYSSLWETGQTTVAPWDVFTFTGCSL